MSERNEKLLRDKDAAALLAVARGRIWYLVKRGIIPQPTRIGRKMSVWRLTDIQRYLDSPELLRGE